MWFSETCTVCNNVTVTVLWCTFSSIKKVLTSHEFIELHCTEFQTTKIAADSVKFYCRLLVKLSLLDSKLNCVQYKFS